LGFFQDVVLLEESFAFGLELGGFAGEVVELEELLVVLGVLLFLGVNNII
jgi:hypothetical protein